MNRRGWLAAAAGIMFVVALAAGSVNGASGDPQGGSSGTFLSVDPEPTALPSISDVTLTGIGFLSVPDSTGEPASVTVAECVPSIGSCGTTTANFPISASSMFTGTFTVVRMLSLSDSTVDCVEVACVVRADSSLSFASHTLVFSTAPPSDVGPTTTKPLTTGAVPPVTTTVAPVTPTTARPGTPTTVHSSTSTVAPSTTVASKKATVAILRPTTTIRPTTTTSTTAAPTTSTTAPPTTTTTVPPAASPPRPPLIAVASTNQPAGPPGGGLHVEGTGYSCATVYFFFDGTRVGSASPDATGVVSKGGLSVPGDAGSGGHQVTSSCSASGDVVEQTSLFRVTPASVHRPAFVTSLPLPSQISLSPATLLTSASVAVGALLLIAFPFELFNSTMEENYDEIRGWFGMGARGVDDEKTGRRTVAFFVLTAVSAVACGFLSPGFGLNMTSLVTAIGMFVALLIMAVVFSIPADIGIHRQFGEWGKLNFLPGSVLISLVLVGLSRVFHFQPGYFYGALAGLAFRSALSERVQGKMTAANWTFSLVVSVAAWFLRVPVSSAAAKPGASVWWIGLEVCLAMIFLWGVEGLAVAMLPLHFMDGRKVFRWSRIGWAVLFFVGLFATFEVLLAPGSGYVGHTTGGVAIGVMVLYALFGLVSVGFWAYFRFRPSHWAPAAA